MTGRTDLEQRVGGTVFGRGGGDKGTTVKCRGGARSSR